MRVGLGARPVAGRFVLLDEIASGGMSAVWRAWDLRERRCVAVKVLAREHGGLLLRFVQEQSIRVRHPHVVAPYTWAADEERVLFAMDLVRGGSVETLARRHGRGLPAGVVADLLGQLLDGLAAVHRAGVVHRDVKPGNLLLEPTGTGRSHLRLADFGVAARLGGPRLTQAPGLVGTDGYVAPEVACGAAPSPVQDLYAVGVVAAVLLTGCGPRTAVPALGDGPLEQLVRALTDAEPARRPPDAAAALARVRGLRLPEVERWPVVVDGLGPDPSYARVDWLRLLAITGFAVALLLGGTAVGLAWG